MSSPGAAASALTVGAVDGADVVADFSSRGPLVNTRAAKPELVAPGVDIIAARAAGTTMGKAIDERYVAASGTSMAAPHVAGAAAVLAQRHPDWRGEQLKAALVGATDPLAGGDPYTSGAGRLNVAKALSGVVSDQPVVNLGTLAYPQSGTAEAKLAWANTGTRTATVALDVAVTDHHGNAAPAGAVSLSDRTLRLAAGAGGGTKLTVDRAAFADRPGLYTAVVTARVGRGVVARTPVTFYVEPPSHDLTVATTAIPGTSDGSYAFVWVQVVNLDDPAVHNRRRSTEAGQPLTFRVPAGRYSVMGSFMSWGNGDDRSAMAGDPDVAITADTSLTLDLSKAKRLTASVDGVATEASTIGITSIQMPRRGAGWTDFAFAWGEAAKTENVFVVPNTGTGIGTFRAYATFGLGAPGSGHSPYLYDLIHPYGNGIPDEPAYRVTAAEQATLARIDQRFSRLDAPDSVTRHKRYGFSEEGVYLTDNDTDLLSGDRVDYVSSEYAWVDEAFWDGIVIQESPTSQLPGQRAADPGAAAVQVGDGRDVVGGGVGERVDPARVDQTRIDGGPDVEQRPGVHDVRRARDPADDDAQPAAEPGGDDGDERRNWRPAAANSANPHASGTGSSTPVIISSSARSLCRAPTNSASASIRRDPPGPATCTAPPQARSTAGSSAAGSAWAITSRSVLEDEPRVRRDHPRRTKHGLDDDGGEERSVLSDGTGKASINIVEGEDHDIGFRGRRQPCGARHGYRRSTGPVSSGDG